MAFSNLKTATHQSSARPESTLRIARWRKQMPRLQANLCATGTLRTMKRDEAERRIQAYGHTGASASKTSLWLQVMPGSNDRAHAINVSA